MKKKNHASPTRSKLTVLRQVCNLIPPHLVRQLAHQTGADLLASIFFNWSHVVALLYAQLVRAIGLNDVCDGLRLHSGPLSAIRGATPPSKNGLSHANKERPAQMAEQLFWQTLEHLKSHCAVFAGRHGRRVAGRFRRAIHVVDSTTLQLIAACMDYPGDLCALVGSFGPKLKQFAFGQDDRPLELGDEIKSISGEETFLKDTDDRKVLRGCLRTQAADISARLKHRRLGAQTVQVKVRYGDFTTLTRQITVEDPLTEAGDIYRLGCFLLGREKLVSRPLRLLGLGVASLRDPTARQLVLL
jgi:hypothetical protein